MCLLRSPDPINWTVPLDTGKTFSVTQSVRDSGEFKQLGSNRYSFDRISDQMCLFNLKKNAKPASIYPIGQQDIRSH